MKQSRSIWYREPTMLVVAGVLAFTVTSGMAMLSISLQSDDVLIMSDADYREWKDEMRAATPLSAESTDVNDSDD